MLQHSSKRIVNPGKIEPEWAYGKKGQPDAGIGPNQTLYFEITLDRIG